jgi:tetratricopeptide (TPR) repeat protein
LVNDLKKRGNFMKKKCSVLIIVLMAFLVFANTGYAKSVSKKITAIFGSYVIKINGKTQSTETLANGSKVYIPINDLTKLTGAAVKKTGTTYAITPVAKDDGVTKKNVDAVKKELEKTKQELEEALENLKKAQTEDEDSDLDDVVLMVQYMDTYKNLEDFQGYLYYMNDMLNYSYFAIKDGGDEKQLNETEIYYNSLVEELNAMSDNFEAITEKAESQGFDSSDDQEIVEEIVAKYESSLKLMEEAINLLKKYAETSEEKFADDSYDKASEALDAALEAQEKAYDEYIYYFEEISE